MALSQTECAQFSNFLGRTPYNWDKKISKDRKPYQYIYATMYRNEKWESFTGDNHLWEKVHVARPNDPGLWAQFNGEACVGNPCDLPRKGIGYGVSQYRYEHYREQYMTEPFCLDQLNSVEHAVEKLAIIAKALKKVPEQIISSFLRVYVLRRAGNALDGAGLFLAGAKDSSGNPVSITMDDSMFAVSEGQTFVGSNNTLLINLNANGALTALGITTSALLAAAMGQLSMEYLKNMQLDLAAEGYNDTEWMPAGKFSITADSDTQARLAQANPALTAMYHGADFEKGGAFYGYGVVAGVGNWLFKDDYEQMRFRFRGDMDGKNLSGGSLSGAIWIEQVQIYENVAATYGLKPRYSLAWKNAPIRMYHAYNREARAVKVRDITSVNDEMKFGLSRSMMGDWKWYSPDYFKWTNPCTGVVCEFNNDNHNKGYWLAEFDYGMKTEFPEIERVILALGEPQQYVRVPNTVTPLTAPVAGDYQELKAYNCGCPEEFSYPPQD